MEEELNPDVAQEAVKRWLALADSSIAEHNEHLANITPAAEGFALRYASLQGRRDAFLEARRAMREVLLVLQHQQPHEGE